MSNTPDQAAVPNELLIGFLNHDLKASDNFIKAVDPYLLKLARARAPKLPTDLHEEIVNETYLRLLRLSPEKFNPKRGTATSFIYGELLNAIQYVRSTYCAPGSPTRNRKRRSDDNVNESSNSLNTVSDYTSHLPPVISIEDLGPDGLTVPNGAEAIQAVCDVNRILIMAPPLVAAGLEQIYFSGSTLSESAKALKVSRFKLGREINAFAYRLRRAA